MVQTEHLTNYNIIQLFVSSSFYSLLSVPLTLVICMLTYCSLVIITLAMHVETLKKFDFLGKYTHICLVYKPLTPKASHFHLDLRCTFSPVYLWLLNLVVSVWTSVWHLF